MDRLNQTKKNIKNISQTVKSTVDTTIKKVGDAVVQAVTSALNPHHLSNALRTEAKILGGITALLVLVGEVTKSPPVLGLAAMFGVAAFAEEAKSHVISLFADHIEKLEDYYEEP